MIELINEIFYNGKRIKGKEKTGKHTLWILEDDSSIYSSVLRKSMVGIKCHNCKNIKNVNFYSGKNGLENRVYICTTCNKTGVKNPFYGKSHSKEFKTKLSRERSGKWGVGEKNAMFGVNNWDNYSEDKKTTVRKNLSEACMGGKNGFYGKTHTEKTRRCISGKSKKYIVDHPEHLKKMMEASFKKQSRGFKSSIEKMTEIELSKRNINFKYSKIVHRKYQYDFIIEKDILLEVHGDYWHANPLYYGDESGKKTLNTRQLFKRSQDVKKKDFAEEYGYRIFYLWETEVKNNVFCIIDKIEEIIEGRKYE